MNDIIMWSATIISVAVVGWMLIKKMDIKITLFTIGIILMYIALAMGNAIEIRDFQTSGSAFLDPLKAVIDQFKIILPAAGFIILILGGYSAYMTKIKANDVTVNTFIKPIKKIKSVYILVPVVFLIGNVLSLVVPSASNLAIILLATLYPVLRGAGMSKFTAAAVIATTATVMPTPLGGDNVAIATELAKYPEFVGMSVTDYVLRYHAIVSVPTLFFMAGVHYVWQKFMDKKQKISMIDDSDVQKVEEVKGGMLYKVVYTLLPLFPIIILIGAYISQLLFGIEVNITVEIATVVSFILAILCECIRTKDTGVVLQGTETFFKGMGNAFPIVALLVAASVFVLGLKSLGLISTLQIAMVSIQGTGWGIILPLTLVGLTIIIVLLSGSGTALFYALVPLMVPLAMAAGINPIAITVPMGLAGNLMRAVSPVSAVVVIVAGAVKITPLDVVKRTSIPMISGLIFMFVLSMSLFL